MSNDFEIVFPKKDVVEMMRSMNDARQKLGVSVGRSVQMAGFHLAQSMGASTRVSKKTRKVIKNPHKDAKTDGRRAKFGVMKYQRGTSEKKFVPIYRTGEYGTIRFVDKGKFKLSGRKFRGENGRIYDSRPDPATGIPGPSVNRSPKRKIGMRGFAKSSWKAAAIKAKIGGGAVKISGVSSYAKNASFGYAVGRSYLKGDDPYVMIGSSVSYIEKALYRRAIEYAMRRAADGLEHRVDKELEKRFKTK